MTTITLLLLSILPQDGVARESVDLIELNHFSDEAGRPVFDQVIFYDLAPAEYVVERGFWDTTDETESVNVPTGDGFSTLVQRPKAVLISRFEKVQKDYQVIAWRLVKHPSQIPQRDRKGGGYTAIWQDGEVLRHVWSPLYRESWTSCDPELIERETLPAHERRGLRGGK